MDVIGLTIIGAIASVLVILATDVGSELVGNIADFLRDLFN